MDYFKGGESMKILFQKIILVLFLMFTLTASSSQERFQPEIELKVIGCENVYYYDEFNQKQKMLNGRVYSATTKIIVGKSPEGVIDKGAFGAVLFEGGYYLQSIEEEGRHYQLEGTIFDLIYNEFSVEN